MQHVGLTPDAVTLISLLKACGSIGASENGKRIHDEIIRRGLLENNTILGTALVDMYGKCGMLTQAHIVFWELPARNTVSWNALISGYVLHGQGNEALHCFEEMQHKGFTPNAVTYACVLKACGMMQALSDGELIHEEIHRQGLLRGDIVLGTALLDMYTKCGALVKAHLTIEELPARNVITWSVLIEGYAEQGQGEEALSCYQHMKSEGLSPNSVTFMSVLKACANIRALEKGEDIHYEINARGLLPEDTSLGNALIDMYAKCGALTKAHQVLEHLSHRNVVSWTALIEGYIQQNQSEKALEVYEKLQSEELSPSHVTYGCVLKACGQCGSIQRGRQVHHEIVRWQLLERDTTLGVALVEMYAKCGAFTEARETVNRLPAQDITCWNTLLEGYAQQERSQDVFRCFRELQAEGLSPNAFTYSCILHMCSHAGLVEEGQLYFAIMLLSDVERPDLGHYVCMVDCYGRAGDLNKAVAVIQSMPWYDYPVVWHALLAACSKSGDSVIGTWAFHCALQINNSDDVAYILMANIYAAAAVENGDR
ncbi:hypothetical protein KP509_35G007000 [Ceratopteris richardii]|uniref:Pentatricopeptide repeat-containing protein n=4 Tax=Ceratopteris richardii TaxID=49495 RepID=A0A8T2QEF0_CERRI|nr:hypothetical protein KP509_35G007000 [Ceratopteris richardii]